MSKQDLNILYKKSFTVAQNSAMNLKEKLSTQDYSKIKTNLSNIKLPKNANALKNKNFLIIAGVVVVALGVFAIARQFGPSTSLGFGKDTREVAPKPLATQELNKEFKFPLLNTEGKEVAKISYTVESANIQDEFIYQGKLARAVQGRTFLIFNLKITNPYTQTIEINAKDYIRVKLNGTDEQLASEIHNDPVQIQAKSTKYTRIGLPINDTDKNIILLVGELQGSKKETKLNLSR